MTKFTKSCTVDGCEGTMHRCFTGIAYAVDPPRYPTVWVCLTCGHEERGDDYSPRPTLTPNSAQRKLHQINPQYEFIHVPDSD